MPLRPTHLPTEAELEILHILWERGSATVREVHTALSEKRETGYTTVLKLMQIMDGKGSVTRKTAERSHLYKPALKRDVTQRKIVAGVIAKAFNGSACDLVECALAHAKGSRTETAKIRALLAKK